MEDVLDVYQMPRDPDITRNRPIAAALRARG
jgi:hypothetical protein